MNKPRCFTFVSLAAALVATAMVISACNTSSETLISKPSAQGVSKARQLISTSQEKPTLSNEAEAVSRTKDVHFDVEIPAATKQLVLASESIYIASDWTLPQTRPAAPKVGCWVHRNRVERSRTLAGHEGNLVTDTFTAPGFELVREAWLSKTHDALAIRQRIRNRGAEAIHLDALIPLRCRGPKSLLLADKGADSWEVLAQKRRKTQLPTSVRPGQAKPENLAREIEIDPFCLLHPLGEEQSPALLAGYISQLGHCARLLLKFKADPGGAELEYLTAECEFDGVVLPPGGQRTSQWLLLRASTDPQNLIGDFADRVGQYHGAKEPPKNAPVVPCSWYYHGPNFNEKDFNKTLEYLRKDRIPFDVFLIDECWDLSWGDWLGNDKWPSGMKAAADKIRDSGYRPGLWSCPFIVMPKSRLAKEHPQWLLKREDGTPYIFRMGGPNHVLDPTYPGVCEFLEQTYRRLTRDWGFMYLKFDFMRAVTMAKGIRFYNPSVTRLEAYRMGLEAIKRGTGPDVYISVCGGHYGGSIGIASAQRSGSDNSSQGGGLMVFWGKRTSQTFQQNTLRTWMNRLWHVNPDAMMVRRVGDHPDQRLSDTEARTFAVNQYIGGGMVKLTFAFAELDDFTRRLYRHIIPSLNSSSIPLDLFEQPCPSKLLTRVTPRCSNLEPWVTVAVVNWTDQPKNMSLALSEKVTESMTGPKFLVFDFFTQKALGIFDKEAEIDLGEQAPHESRVLRITPWNGREPVLAGTDLHFSGGGVEIASWQANADEVSGIIQTIWNYPVTVTAAFPNNDGYVLNTATVEPGQDTFRIAKPK